MQIYYNCNLSFYLTESHLVTVYFNNKAFRQAQQINSSILDLLAVFSASLIFLNLAFLLVLRLSSAFLILNPLLIIQSSWQDHCWQFFCFFRVFFRQLDFYKVLLAFSLFQGQFIVT